MSQLSLVIWGAGRIGRGFAADLFAAAGYRITFVDQAESLIASLNQAGRYTVVRAQNAQERSDRIISGFDALLTSQTAEVAEAIAAADLLAVCVFPKDFTAVGQALAPALALRKRPLDILLFTNLTHAGPQFRAGLPATTTQVGIVETLVIRMVTEPPADELVRDPLLVWTNGYAELPVDRRAFVGLLPAVPGLRPVDDMRAEETRKLYTYNTFHAALAYFGAPRGIEKVVDCLADPEVRAAAAAALAESSAALQAEYGFSAEAMARWNANVVAHTDNPALGDTVARFAADPRRKLARADRILGPLLLCQKHGLPYDALARTAAAALVHLFLDTEERRNTQMPSATNFLPHALHEICSLTPSEINTFHALRITFWSLLAERARKLGFDYEQTYHGCGQCAFAAITDTLGQFDEKVFEAATPLAGGLGLAGDSTCGALLGATLAMGLVSPRHREQFGGDKERKYRAFEMAQKLRQKYLDTYGSLRCHDIHRQILGRSFDLREREERHAFEAAGAHDDKCTNVVARAAGWAVEIIGEAVSA